MSKKIKVLLLACVLAIICCVGFTVGATDEAKAEVKGHSLTITDTGISVNFYVAIQGDVQVTLNENEVDLSTMETEEIVIDAKAYDCYVFTEPVVAKEMDDDVTLSIVSGTTELVKDSYRVNDYVAEVQQGGYNYNFESLANAMTYYGEFAEVYFGYKGATSAGDDANSYIEGVKESYFDSYAATVKTTNMPEGLEFYGTMLNLNSKTTLRLLFTVEGKEASSFGTFTANGEDLGELKPYKTYYYVDIEGIGAAQLDNAYTIKCGDAEIISNCSVLTYARSVVNAYSDKEDATDKQKNLLNVAKALYLYNQKADTYVDAQVYAVYDMFYGNDGFSATPGTRTPIYLTANGDVTSLASGNTEITSLNQLSGSRTKGFSVWMETAYTVSGTESLTGPYVIRRYTENTGNVLNVAGTATLTTTIDRSTGDFVAQYPGNQVDVTISELAASEVSASGTLNVTGSAKTGVITVAEGNIINADGLTAEGEVVFASHEDVNLSGNADVSAIKLLDDGMGHFDIVKHNNNVRVASVICVCGDDVTGETIHEDCPWAGENGIAAVYNIDWKPWDETYCRKEWPEDAFVILPSIGGSYYLVNDMTNTTATGVNSGKNLNLDLAGHKVIIEDSRIFAVKGGTLNITDSANGGKLQCNTGGVLGGVIRLESGTVNVFGGTMTNSAEEATVTGAILDQQAGVFNMYGGEILPGSLANAVRTKVGMNIFGGTVKGDVLIFAADATMNISGSAEVGSKDKNDSAYGIYGNANATNARLVCDNVEGNNNIVLKDRTSVALSGTGEASAFKLLEDGAGHFGVVNYNDGTAGNAVKFGSIICVCGDNVRGKTSHDNCSWAGEDGITAVHGIKWEPWSTAISKEKYDDYVRLPIEEGSYYLTGPVEGINARADIANGVKVNLDLGGYTAEGPGQNGWIYRLNVGTLNITDSSPEKSGAIKCTGVNDSAYGRVIYIWGNSSNSNSTSCVNLYGGTLAAAEGATGSSGVVVRVDNGTFNMYKGSIQPGTSAEEADSNSVKLGNELDTKSAILNVSGGIINGEVLLNESSATLNISGSAKVGASDGTGKGYGIYAPSTLETAPSIECDCVKTVGEGKNIVIKDERFVALSGTGEGSAFEISENLHNKVVDDETLNDGLGNLKFVARMCNCGALENGTHHYKADGTQACGVPQNQAWEPWNVSVSIAADEAAGGTGRVRAPFASGSYYLTENIEAAAINTLSNGTIVNLDLAGKTIATTKGRIYTLGQNATATLSIADSVGEGALRFPTGSTATAYDLIWMRADNSVLNLFGGSLTAEGTTSTYASSRLVQRTLGQFYWYGGRLIQNGTITAYSQTTANNSKGFNNPYGLAIETVE